MEMSPADVQASFCACLADEWAKAGVTDAVVAPGSRSTPLVDALDRKMRVHVFLDEREAGFAALGIGLATGRPAVVATTSGTAAVELHPSVVEAAQAGVPLLAVTADRPPELHHVGAPQTVEQHGLFAAAVRWSFDPGVAEEGSQAAWRSVASRCVAEALAGPGPVHLNLPFREPLTGAAGPLPEGRAGPWHAVARPAPPSADPETAALLRAERGLILAGAGAGDPAEVLGLARRLGWPVLADPRSGCRLPDVQVVAAADALLRVPGVAAWRPEVVLRLGAPWASKVVSQWLAGLACPQVLSDPAGRWADPERTASHVTTAGAGALAASVDERRPGGWLRRWQRAEEAAQAAIGSLLDKGRPLELSEPAVARACAAGTPAGGVLFASSSMPVRDVEWYGAPRGELTVLSNRGANGIDGVLSTAIGAALGSGAPTVALLGDLAFLYGAGSLLWAAGRPVRLLAVVVDNDGGGIFSFLPQARAFAPERFETYWGTPHGIDLAAVAAAYGVPATRLADREALDNFVASAPDPGVRVGVVASDRGANPAVHDRVHAAVADAVAPVVADSLP
jgi:2-succinyl-5-enolpyruvyl-6-hydroxy-3-cyclohexene-1-carboxylate synthase